MSPDAASLADRTNGTDRCPFILYRRPGEVRTAAGRRALSAVFCPCQLKTNGASGNRRLRRPSTGHQCRKHDGEDAAEVESERDGQDISKRTDVTDDVTATVAVNSHLLAMQLPKVAQRRLYAALIRCSDDRL